MNKLLDILLRQDDNLLRRFCDVLTAHRQPHVVEILRRNGLQLKYNILRRIRCGSQKHGTKRFVVAFVYRD